MRGEIIKIIGRKYGFVHRPGAEDVYFHIADFPAAQIGSLVEFETIPDGQRRRATKIRAAS